MAQEDVKQAMYNRGYEQGYATGKIHAHRETHAHIVSMVLSVGGELVIDRSSAEDCQGYNLAFYPDKATGDMRIVAMRTKP